MGLLTRIADKAGALGSVVSAKGCGACHRQHRSLFGMIGPAIMVAWAAWLLGNCWTANRWGPDGCELPHQRG